MKPRGLLESILRFALAWAFFIPVAIAVLVVAVVLLPWRGARVRMSYWAMNRVCPAMLWAMGVELDAPPPAEIAARAPAIYVINHTSGMDTALAGALLPPGTCGLTKKESIFYPFFGQAYWLSGHLFIDRGNRERAIASVDRLVAVMKRYELSAIIGPEGTRSRDGRLATFKKGFAHLAIATRLPVVPIVIEGAQRAWPVGHFRLTPHPVRVRMLPSISTETWSTDTLIDHVAEVHGAIAAALPLEQRPL